jgi:hypothetical protein
MVRIEGRSTAAGAGGRAGRGILWSTSASHAVASSMRTASSM